MQTVVITSPACDAHQTDGHIEAVERRSVVMDYIAEQGLLDGRPLLEATPATDDDLHLVHTPRYTRLIGEIARAGGGWLDHDTLVSSGSDLGSRAAVGAAMLAVDGALTGARRAMAIVRPPGHHALAGRGMGFCLYNGVAVAAAHALARHGLSRVLIVDWDVHHGNGTEAIFAAEPRVCFFSIHQWPHYPGTGPVDMIGSGPGLGTTVNVPVPAGAGDAAYARVFREVLAPIARRYRPELLLVSAGFDAHRDDPLGGTRLTAEGFAGLTRQVVGLAEELCAGRVAYILEGGYNLLALARSVAATLEASDRSADAPAETLTPTGDDERLVQRVIAEARRVHQLE